MINATKIKEGKFLRLKQDKESLQEWKPQTIISESKSN